MVGPDARRRAVIAGVAVVVTALLPQHAGSASLSSVTGSSGKTPLLPLSGAPSGPLGTAGAASPIRLPRWLWPLAPRPVVVRPFSAPASTYGAGHRGVDLAAEVGAPVMSVAVGTVSHVGVINGRGTVSVLHPSGIRSTYEPVTASVTVGDVIEAADPIGSVEAVEGHCAPSTCVHLGAIRDRTYLDPLTLLTVPRIVLLPPLPE